ncbi:MAG: aminotransferase class I/II-fold pyridoxal phosphate-dependent enzyme [Rickettsiales bacterium]|nr:aminotransferase class I/II-fold pyridoxal phosphate-dependent enzyme [Rickettsiales bacterium]
MQTKFTLTETLPPYIFATMGGLKKEAAARGLEVIDFGLGSPDSAPPAHAIAKLIEVSQNTKLYGYSAVGGIEPLKQAVASYYKRRFDVDLDCKSEVIVTIGSKEGLTSLATAIADKDNYLVVPNPCYPIHTFAFVIAKSNVAYINATKGSEFLVQFKEFIEKTEKKPVAVIVNYPSNPTSELVGLDFYEELVAFCTRHQIYIISDAVYSEIYFDDNFKPASILQVKGAKDIAIEFYSMSKSYSLAGARIGFALGNPTLVAAMHKLKSYLDYSQFEPMQVAACEALSEKSDDYLVALRMKYKNRAELLVKLLDEELSWKASVPKGSMYIWTKIPQQFSHMNSFDFCKKLLAETGVALSPGSGFGANGEGFVRFSLIRELEEMRKAVTKMRPFFAK